MMLPQQLRAGALRAARRAALRQRRWQGGDDGFRFPSEKFELKAEPRDQPATYEEGRQFAGEEMKKYRDALFNEPEDVAKKLVERRRRLFSDDRFNKLEFSFGEEEFVPQGTALDHLMVKDHGLYVTHMVPVKRVRSLVPDRLSLLTIVHEMDEWALLTTRHARYSRLTPLRGVFGSYNDTIDVVTYLTYATDRNTGERVEYVFSHYSTKHKLARRARNYWMVPVHELADVRHSAVHDGEKFTEYSLETCGSGKSRAGALRLCVEDTGIDATRVKSFAGFRNAESALVFLTNTQVSIYQQIDMQPARSDVGFRPLPAEGKVTVGRLLRAGDGSYSGNVGAFDPEKLPREAPEGVYPWLLFWDVMGLSEARQLHSCLLFKGPQEVTQFMPITTYDDQMVQTVRHTLPVRFFRAVRNAWSSKSVAVSPRQMSNDDYEKLWQQGKYT